MERTMKKATAILIALLIMIQLVPAFAITYSSGMIVGSPNGFKEPLEIVASKGTYVLMGQTLELDVNEDYIAVWSSDDPGIAMIDENGLLTAVAPGTVAITAECGLQKATAEITVLDPAPLIAEAVAEEPQAEPVQPEEPAQTEGPAQPEETEQPEKPEQTEQPEQTAQQPAPQTQPAQKKLVVIVINGENDRVTYDGKEHTLDRFIATGNDEDFDPEKVTYTGELGVTGKDCGIYELNLENVTFSYDDPNVIPTFVVNNSYMRITPASVTVTADIASKKVGEADPEMTATVVGLCGEDTIDYTLTREPGEGVGEYIIEAAGAEQQGNYRINYVSGKFSIEGEPTVTIEVSIPDDQEVFSGTKVILKAVTFGFGDVELTYQWQWSLDDEHWNDIEGETKRTYTFYTDETNYNWYYRVNVNPAE